MNRSRGMPWVARASPAAPPARLPCLGLSMPVGTRPGQAIIRAVLDRVGGIGTGVGTVVLQVCPDVGISPGDCAALLSLHNLLTATGTRLRLAGVGTVAWPGLVAGGIAEALGPGSVHPTLRSAMLAACAEQPGPGLCTAQVRALLAAPAEPLRVAAPAEPLRVAAPLLA